MQQNKEPHNIVNNIQLFSLISPTQNLITFTIQNKEIQSDIQQFH